MLNPYGMLAAIIMATGIFGGGYFYGRHVQGINDDANMNAERLTWTWAVAEGQKAENDAIQANDALKTQLEVQHAQANDALNVLLSHPAGGVQLPANCAAASGETHATSGGAVQTASGERAFDPLQAALDDFTRGMEADAAEWSRAINACAVVIGWARQK